MGKRFKIFCPVSIVLVFSPAFLPPNVPHSHFESPHLVVAQQETRGQKPDTQHNLAEILAPPDWVARGGCWFFSGKIIAAPGVYLRGLALFYYNKRAFTDFVFEVRLNKLAEDGPFGLLIRYDEKTKEGYTYLLFPHGGYGFYVLKNERDSSLFSFDFLGFEFRWENSRKGKKIVKLRTSRKKFRRSLQNFTEWSRENRSTPIRKLLANLNRKLRGYYNYFGVIGNYERLQKFFYQAMGILKKWLNRRSQRKSFNWKTFRAMLNRHKIERPRITERPEDHPRREGQQRLQFSY